MLETEWNEAWKPAIRNIFGNELLNIGGPEWVWYGNKMDTLLKVKEFKEYRPRSFEDDIPAPPKLLRIVKLLGGPHWKTVLKLLEIQGKIDVSVLPSK